MYKYLCIQPILTRSADDTNPSPMMDNEEMQFWLNDMDRQGWEFVGCGQKIWHKNPPFTQIWWIFRRPEKKKAIIGPTPRG